MTRSPVYVMLFFMFVGSLCARASTAAGSALFEQMKNCGRGIVVSVSEHAELVLDNGLVISLALIHDPSNDLTHHLKSIVTGQHVRLKCEGRRQSRFGAIKAQVIVGDNLWLQAELIQQGHVFLYAESPQHTPVQTLRDLENKARAQKLGLWAGNYYQTTTTKDAPSALNFIIAQGVVQKTARVGRTVYLNFGDDYRSDFTASIPVSQLKYYAENKIDPLALSGKMIEVRGYSAWRGGPYIALTYPANLVLINEE